MKLGDKFTMNVPVRRKWWQVCGLSSPVLTPLTNLWHNN